GHEQAVFGEVGQRRLQRLRRIVRAHRDHADIVSALDLIGKENRYFYIERPVRHIDLQTLLSDRFDMLFIRVDKTNVMSRAREPAADDSADGAGADDKHALTHVKLLVCAPNALTICNERNS